jgi:uncharacterized repeat protein (TIGR03803 family)
MTAQSAICKTLAERFLLCVMAFITPVMVAGLDLAPAAAASFTTLYQFRGGSDGGHPAGPVTQGPDGALYGMTQSGGCCGTVFRLAPRGGAGQPWSHTVLHAFEGSDGAVLTGGYSPDGGLAFGRDGAVYGTTIGGGN